MPSFLNYSVVALSDIHFDKTFSSIDTDEFKKCDFAIEGFGTLNGLSIEVDVDSVTKDVSRVVVHNNSASFLVSDTPSVPSFLNLDTTLKRDMYHSRFQSNRDPKGLVCGVIFHSMVRLLLMM